MKKILIAPGFKKVALKQLKYILNQRIEPDFQYSVCLKGFSSSYNAKNNAFLFEFILISIIMILFMILSFREELVLKSDFLVYRLIYFTTEGILFLRIVFFLRSYSNHTNNKIKKFTNALLSEENLDRFSIEEFTDLYNKNIEEVIENKIIFKQDSLIKRIEHKINHVTKGTARQILFSFHYLIEANMFKRISNENATNVRYFMFLTGLGKKQIENHIKILSTNDPIELYSTKAELKSLLKVLLEVKTQFINLKLFEIAVLVEKDIIKVNEKIRLLN